jgi:U3 small nucleolar RNA-associated protein 20
MVKSQSGPVRQMCAASLLQFLLDFPLGERRLQQHVAFLVANLGYEYESGRLQALEMLSQVGAGQRCVMCGTAACGQHVYSDGVA